MHLGFEDQTFGIHEQVTLPAAHLLATVVSPLFAANASGIG
jgi:hypothetical protein